MENILEMLKGKKTYIVIVLGALTWVGVQFGWITPDAATSIYEGLILLGGATVAAKINRLK